MMCPDAKVQKVYLYPKPVDFRKFINGLAALVELDIKVEVFNRVLFVFLNRTRSQVKILYWERNSFCLWLKRLEAERFKTKLLRRSSVVANASKPLPANLPRVEVIHELPVHELTCACSACKQVIGEETSEQLEIIPMQVRVLRHIRKTYAKACKASPLTADKPAQLIEKSLASPSVLAMLLTTKYADGIPLYCFEKMLSRHGVDIPRQTLARWVIQSGEQLQPLLNLMRDKLLEHPVLHCDETRLQVLHEPGRDPTAQSWMRVQSGGPPDKPVILFDYTASRAGGALAPARRLSRLPDDRRQCRLQRRGRARGHRTSGLLGACAAQVRRRAEGAAQGQDRPRRHGAESDQQALRHQARPESGQRQRAPGRPSATQPATARPVQSLARQNPAAGRRADCPW